MSLQPPSRSFNVMSLPDSFLPAYPRSLNLRLFLCSAELTTSLFPPSDSVEALPSTPRESFCSDKALALGLVR